MTYTVLGTLEYGPIRARSPWQGLVALVVGAEWGVSWREKERPRRGDSPALRERLEASRPRPSWKGVGEQCWRSCQTGFCRGRTSSLSHAAYISLTASLNGVWFDVTSSSVANEGFFPTRGYDDYSFRTFRSGLIEPF